MVSVFLDPSGNTSWGVQRLMAKAESLAGKSQMNTHSERLWRRGGGQTYRRLIVAIHLVSAIALTMLPSTQVASAQEDDDFLLLLIPTIAAANRVELSANSLAPLRLLTVTWRRFDPTAAIAVRFFDDQGYDVEVPVIDASATSVTVFVPPFIDLSTGAFAAGTVDVQVVQTKGGVTLRSNVRPAFQIGPLRSPTAPPGFVTLAMLEAVDVFGPDINNTLSSLQGTSTDDLLAGFNAMSASVARLRDAVRFVMANPAAAVVIGELDGNSVVLTQDTLREMDRVMANLLAYDGPNSAILCPAADAIKAQIESADNIDNLRVLSRRLWAEKFTCTATIVNTNLTRFAGATGVLGVAAWALGFTVAGPALLAISAVAAIGAVASLALTTQAVALRPEGATQQDAENAQDAIGRIIGTYVDPLVSLVGSAFSQGAGIMNDLYNDTRSVIGATSTFVRDLDVEAARESLEEPPPEEPPPEEPPPTAGAGVLAVSPTTGFFFSGPEGGPFSGQTSQNYTLTNTGGATLNFIAVQSTNWINLSQTSGSLAAGASTSVLVEINTNVFLLPPGNFTNATTFVNTTNEGETTVLAGVIVGGSQPEPEPEEPINPSCCIEFNGCPGETGTTCGINCCCCSGGFACSSNFAEGCVPAS